MPLGRVDRICWIRWMTSVWPLLTSAPQFIQRRTVDSPCRDFDSTNFTSLTALTAFSIGYVTVFSMSSTPAPV
jgi:hypothetical protein